MDSCFICEQFVFGLRGQDDFLDSALLSPGDDAIVNRACGACHLRCLLGTRWGSEWAGYRLRRWESNAQMTRMYSDDTCVALAHRQTKDIYVIQTDGMSWTFRRRMFDTFSRMASGWQLPIEEEFNFEIRGKGELIEKLQKRLSLNGEVPLVEVLQVLGVADKLYSPLVLAEGRLVLKQELKRYWTAAGISSWASYAEPVPDQIYSVWKHCAFELGCLPIK